MVLRLLLPAIIAATAPPPEGGAGREVTPAAVEAEALCADAAFLRLHRARPEIALRVFRALAGKILAADLSGEAAAKVAGAFEEACRDLVPPGARDSGLRRLERSVRRHLGRVRGSDVVESVAEEIEAGRRPLREVLEAGSEELAKLGYGAGHLLEPEARETYAAEVGRWVAAWDARAAAPDRLVEDLAVLARWTAPLPAGAIDRFLAGFGDRLAGACTRGGSLRDRLGILARLNPCLDSIRAAPGFERAASEIDGRMRRAFRAAPRVLPADELTVDLPPDAERREAAGARLEAVRYLDPESGSWMRIEAGSGAGRPHPFFLLPGVGLCLGYRLRAAEGSRDSPPIATIVLLPRGDRSAGLDEIVAPLPRAWIGGRPSIYLEEGERAVSVDASPWTQAEVLARLSRHLAKLGTVGPEDCAAIKARVRRLIAASNLPPRLDAEVKAAASVEDLAAGLGRAAGGLEGKVLLFRGSCGAEEGIRDLVGKLLRAREELPGKRLAEEIARLGEAIGFDRRGASRLLDEGFQVRPEKGDAPAIGLSTVIRLRPRADARRGGR